MSLSELLERVKTASGADRELDAEVARALGWRERRVTRLGLRGRTPGSYRWFSPDEQWGDKGSATPPRLTGPRGRQRTITLLEAKIAEDKP